MNKLLQKSFVALAASVFLMACGEDSSDSFGGGAKEDYCKVVQKDPLVIEAVEDGFFSKTTFEYDDGEITETIEFKNHDAVELACSEYAKDSDYRSVECSDKSIVAVGKKTFTASEYKRMMDTFASACEEVNEAMSSSSSAKSSSSTKSSSSVASSSSSAKSSSSVAPSSSSVNSSSSSVGNDNVMSAMYVQYWNDKVVAQNADDLEGCEDGALSDDMDQYEIAYEFNDPYDLGADYIGEKTNAYQDVKVPGVFAECGSIVLDGTNGLIVPKNDIFRTKGFVVEVRFMPTDEGDLANLFVADPPGSGVDGWQVRFDGTEARFHIRDGSEGGWNIYNAGEVSLNEWHVFRVKLFPTKSDDGIISYTLSLSLDGVSFEGTPFKGDVSDFDFDVGIGYDAVYQGEHERRTFKGKIDYIRYGRITEDGL